MSRVLAVAAMLVTLALLSIGLGVAPPAARAHHLCGATGSPAGPFDIEAYEAADYKYTYARTLELAGFNQLFPEYEPFAMPRVETGNRAAGSSQTGDSYVPPVILKAIAWIESGWAQASNYDPLVQYGEVGPALISHDCEYGIMQVTSGMQNVTGSPSLEQAMIGGHYAFNIARGTRILVEKWNQAPETRPVVGERDPHVIENLYFALWAYNGYAFKNHPLNPAYDPQRVPFSCGPVTDGFGHDGGGYPYQELVMGCAAHPPVRNGVPLWEAVEVHLPDLADPQFAEPLKVENWNPCSYQLQCAPMDIPTPNTSHRDPSSVTVTRAQVIGAPVLSLFGDQLKLTPASSPDAKASAVISNSGTGVLAWRATASARCIKLSRTQWVVLGAELGGLASTLTIRADAAGLASGVNAGQVIIEVMHAGGAPRIISVTYENYGDGALVRGSGPTVYAMKGGLKRPIPNVPTFLAAGFQWGNVAVLSDEALGALPTGNAWPDIVASGNLIRGSEPTVYVTDGQAKRAITSPDVLAGCGYGWDAVRPVSDEALGTIPTGPALSGSPCPRFQPADGSIVQTPDGVRYLIRGGLRRAFPHRPSLDARGGVLGNIDAVPASSLAGIPQGRSMPDVLIDGNLFKAAGPTIYIMKGGWRYAIPNPDALFACGHFWDEVQAVSESALMVVLASADPVPPPCPTLIPANGSLVRGPDGTIYLVDQRRKRRIPSWQVFQALGLQWGEVDQYASTTVANIPSGPDMPEPGATGSLLKGSDPAIWVVENGARRRITSIEAFIGCGYDWGKVAPAADSFLEQMAVGPDLNGPPCP